MRREVDGAPEQLAGLVDKPGRRNLCSGRPRSPLLPRQSHLAMDAMELSAALSECSVGRGRQRRQCRTLRYRRELQEVAAHNLPCRRMGARQGCACARSCSALCLRVRMCEVEKGSRIRAWRAPTECPRMAAEGRPESVDTHPSNNAEWCDTLMQTLDSLESTCTLLQLR